MSIFLKIIGHFKKYNSDRTQFCTIRETYVYPPREAGLPKGSIWKLNKSVYGLIDASRSFYLNYASALMEQGMEVCRYDPAVFVKFDDKSTKESFTRTPSGILPTHVDDALSTGSKKFKKVVMMPILKKFAHGSQEKLPFTYIGLQTRREDVALVMDQDHYVKSLIVPDLDTMTNSRMDDTLGEGGQKVFRSVAAKLGMLSVVSRPDIAYVSKVWATRYGKAWGT